MPDFWHNIAGGIVPLSHRATPRRGMRGAALCGPLRVHAAASPRDCYANLTRHATGRLAHICADTLSTAGPAGPRRLCCAKTLGLAVVCATTLDATCSTSMHTLAPRSFTQIAWFIVTIYRR